MYNVEKRIDAGNWALEIGQKAENKITLDSKEHLTNKTIFQFFTEISTNTEDSEDLKKTKFIQSISYIRWYSLLERLQIQYCNINNYGSWK